MLHRMRASPCAWMGLCTHTWGVGSRGGMSSNHWKGGLQFMPTYWGSVCSNVGRGHLQRTAGAIPPLISGATPHNREFPPITDAHLTPQLCRLRARRPSLFMSTGPGVPPPLLQWVDKTLATIALTLPGWANLSYPPLPNAPNPLPPEFIFLNPPVAQDGSHPCVPVMGGVTGASHDPRGYLSVTLLGKTHPCTTQETGAVDRTPIFEKAHRLILWAMLGPPPVGKPHVMHLCNNPSCVSLHHISYGSPLENHPSRNQE
jgi:hypothetical protein